MLSVSMCVDLQLTAQLQPGDLPKVISDPSAFTYTVLYTNGLVGIINKNDKVSVGH